MPSVRLSDTATNFIIGRDEVAGTVCASPLLAGRAGGAIMHDRSGAFRTTGERL